MWAESKLRYTCRAFQEGIIERNWSSLLDLQNRIRILLQQDFQLSHYIFERPYHEPTISESGDSKVQAHLHIKDYDSYAGLLAR